MPVMLLATALFIGVAIDGALTRIDGVILLVAMSGYLLYMYREARKVMKAYEAGLSDEMGDPEESTYLKDGAFVVGGIAGLAIGAKFMVDSATEIAMFFGIPELVIAISIVALGTSLPELATSMVASFREQDDISVGNVIGSNIFNLLFVMGVVASLGTIHIGEDALSIDIWVMLGVSVGIWPFLRTGHTLSRKEGVLLLAVYLGYMISLFLR